MKSKRISTVAVDPANWVSKHADYLYTYAIGRLDDEELCRDLVQETFLAALESLSAFKGQSSERTWLTAILKHKVIDVYRKRGRLQTIEPHEPEPEFFDPGDGHWKAEWAPQPMSFDDPTAQKELNRVLQQCLRKLPALWLNIFSMKHMDDMKAETICKELKVTASNYWVILHRAKVNLRHCIQKEWT